MNFSFNKILLILAVAAALTLAACGSRSSAESKANANKKAEEPQPVTDVATAQAVQRNVPQYFEATGSLISDEQSDVAPTVGGKVLSVNFDVGSFVNRGDVMVRLDSRDAELRLSQAQAQVQQAESQVTQARANVEQARANVRQIREQLGLPEGQNYDAQQIAEVKTARAALELAEKQLRRNERLLESGDVSRTTYDTAKSQRDQARSQYDAAVNNANQRFASIRTAQAQVESSQAGVGTAQKAVDAAQTQVATAQKAVGDAIIRAPISGSILERNADPGEFIGTNNKIATIARTNPIRLRIDVPEQSIGQVRIGQSVTLNTSAYPDQQFSGTIARVIPGLDATSRTLTAEAQVGNGNGLLKPGQFATVRILQSQQRSALMIPQRAVRRDGTSARVFVIRDGRAEQHVVQVGDTDGDLVEIKNGLSPNDAVATNNVDKLNDGVEVK